MRDDDEVEYEWMPDVVKYDVEDVDDEVIDELLV